MRARNTKGRIKRKYVICVSRLVLGLVGIDAEEVLISGTLMTSRIFMLGDWRHLGPANTGSRNIAEGGHYMVNFNCLYPKLRYSVQVDRSLKSPSLTDFIHQFP